ncbi:MAG: 2,3,4,5-tetrahydropyridine-2,6-dicarboxylate N-succinyltransferase, partial [Bdellovibrionota bacterium]
MKVGATEIEAIYKGEAGIPEAKARKMVENIILRLEAGELRVAEKSLETGAWKVNEWVKQAILLFFRFNHSQPMRAGDFSFFDKIPVRQWTGAEEVRVVPPAIVRRGAHVAKGAILMPSYVNIGAFVDEGSMVDTWATVGSCAQIGKGVHLSGGVGIGGVLEPLQAAPVIIEDHAFIGSRCIVVEGVIVEESAVLGAGVVITASTKIVEVTAAKPVIHLGRVPAHAVVI